MLSGAPKCSSFGANQRLARYIDPEFRQRDEKGKATSIYGRRGEQPETVSPLTVSKFTLNNFKITAIYAEKFKEERPVALSTPSIEDYNRAAAEAGLSIQGYHADDPHWTHVGPKGDEPSYRHDPKIKNEFHCLVSYTRLLNEVAEFKIRR